MEVEDIGMAILLKPLQNTTELGEADIAKAQVMYWEILTKTNMVPRGVWDAEDPSNIRYREVDPSYIEIAGFFLSGGTLEGFMKHGLGVITVVNASECVKLLISFPGQVLPWHAHISVAVAPKGFQIPDGHLDLHEIISGFQGDPEYGPDAVYFVPGDFLERADFELKPGWKEQGVVCIRGKEETFTVFAGLLEVYGPGEGIPAEEMPEGHRQFETQRLFELHPGDSYHLPCNRPHLAIGGPDGCVFLESSTSSRDWFDYFFNKEISRFK